MIRVSVTKKKIQVVNSQLNSINYQRASGLSRHIDGHKRNQRRVWKKYHPEFNCTN